MLPAGGQAQSDYLGPHSVLMRMRTPPSGSAMFDPRIIFCNDLEEFADKAAKLSPDQAAHAWLALVRRASELDGKARTRGSRLALETLKVLPSPDSWPLISQNLAEAGSSKRADTLRLLFDVLQGNDSSARDRLKTYPKDDPIRLPLAIRMRDADAIEEAVKVAADAIRLKPPATMRSGPTMELPNLVPLLGPERAERVISYVLFTAKAELVGPRWSWRDRGSDQSTRNLARKIAIAHVDRLAWPQWTLATGPEGGDSFLRMKRRFPKVDIGSSNGIGSSMQGAAVSCLTNLYAAGQVERARAFAVANRESLYSGWPSMSAPSLVDRLQRSGKLHGFLSLLDELSRRYPDSALPHLYLHLAQENQALPATESFLRHLAASARDDFSNQNALVNLRRTLLQEGKLAEAAKVFLREKKDESEYDSSSRISLLLALGKELNRPDLTRRGRALERAAFQANPGNADIEPSVKPGQGPQIEKALIAALRGAVTRRGQSSPPEGQSAALALANFYFKIGRYQDVVTLFERFPGWQSPDIQFIEQFESDNVVTLAKSLARLLSQLRLPRIVLISPLCASMRNGWLSAQVGKVLVLNR